MRLIVLNGLTVRPFFDGRIQQYLPGSTEIFKWNWRPRDADSVIKKIGDMYGTEPYVLIGFSDGATLSHQVAMRDKCCAGLIAHSTMFAPPDILHDIPVLLLRTEGDKTPCFKQTLEMHRWYNAPERNLTLTSSIIATIPFTEPHSWYERVFKHQFHNGVELISEWLYRF
jgi:hypothetical protein